MGEQRLVSVLMNDPNFQQFGIAGYMFTYRLCYRSRLDDSAGELS
jgi:hypothetical protein